MTLEWRGQKFVDQTDLAAEAGVYSSTVSFHLKKHKNLDRLGIGPGFKKGSHPRAKPITVDGVEYTSGRAFAAQWDVRLQTVQDWLRTGRMDKLVAVTRGKNPRWER